MSDPKAVLAGRRILVIEDDALLAMELADELEEIGAEPIGPMMSVAAALEALRTYQEVDAALLNVNLRSEASFPVIDALTERRIPFLFVTGNDEFVRERYPDIPYHPKPADMPVLIATLAELLQGSVQKPRE